MPEFLPCVDIGKMNLNGGDADSRDSVPEGNAGVGISRRIQDQQVEFPLGLLNPSDQLALLIRLAEINFNPQLRCSLTDLRFDVGQTRPTVDFRLALTEEVQVWPVEE